MTLLEDVRLALRVLRANPAYTTLTLVVLALGIGANAAVFSVANAWLFKGVPFDPDERLVFITGRSSVRPSQVAGVSYPDFLHWRASMKTLEQVGAVAISQASIVDDIRFPQVYQTAQLTPSSFQLIGERPELGRDFSDADSAAGAPPVAILSHELWDRRYARDRSVIGSVVRLNGVPTTIIGVMPAGLAFPINLDLWTSLVPPPLFQRRDLRVLGVFGKMAQSQTVASVQAELDATTANLQQVYPASNQGITAVVQSYRDQFVGTYYPTLFRGLWLAVVFVLIIACGNLAGLQLARATRRSTEFAIRVAIGAKPWQVARQLVVESVLLSAMGGAIAWLLAHWGVRFFDLALTPLGKPRWMTISVDGYVLAYLVGLSIVTGLVFGLAPVLLFRRLDVHSTLKQGGRGGAYSRHGRQLQQALTVAELALALVLLVSAGLMTRNFLDVFTAPIGADARNVLSMHLALPPIRYPSPEAQSALERRLIERVEDLPGVDNAALATNLPATGSTPLFYEIEGAAVTDPKKRPSLNSIVASSNYFRIWNVSARQGRLLAASDDSSSTPVVVVNEAFAGREWHGADPIGKRLRLFNGTQPEAWRTVVGVVPNIVHNTNRRDVEPVVYVPYAQRPSPAVFLVTKTREAPASRAADIRRALQSIDPNVPVFDVATMDERLSTNTASQQFFAVLFSALAAIGLLIAAFGVYALASYSVAQRTKEIGIRIAMGQAPAAVMRSILWSAAWQLVVGLGIGVIGALAATGLIRSVVGRISPTDPPAYLVAIIALAAAVLCGSFLPAWRAVHVDPVAALRVD